MSTVDEDVVSGPSRRQRQRQATLDEIAAAGRDLLREPGGLSLRAVAQRMGMTPPALYRYVADVDDLMTLVADAIDTETGEVLRAARDSQPADDPVAQIVVTAIAFRRWALSHREEFTHVFANPQSPSRLEQKKYNEECGVVFTELMLRIWERHRFPIPAVADLDPAVVASFADGYYHETVGPAIPPEAAGVFWVITQSWVELYGTVSLEVFGHCDPRIIDSGAIFRAMLARQADAMGVVAKLPRLQSLIEAELARR